MKIKFSLYILRIVILNFFLLFSNKNLFIIKLPTIILSKIDRAVD